MVVTIFYDIIDVEVAPLFHVQPTKNNAKYAKYAIVGAHGLMNPSIIENISLQICFQQ